MLDIKKNPEKAIFDFLNNFEKIAEEIVKKAIEGAVEQAKKEAEEKVKEVAGEVAKMPTLAKEVKNKILSEVYKNPRLFKGDKGDVGPMGKSGRDGVDGKNGEDGADGVNGKDGKNGKDGSSDKGVDIARKLNQEPESVEPYVVRGLRKTIADLKRQKEKGGGGGGGGGMGNFVYKTFSASGTTYSLDYKVAGSTAIMLLYNGQPLELGTHYTVSAKTITLTFTPENGLILWAWYIRA